MSAASHRVIPLHPRHSETGGQAGNAAPGPRVVAGNAAPRPLLGESLLARRVLAPDDLNRALAIQSRQEARLGDILIANGMVAEADLLDCLARQWGTEVVDLAATPPDARLVDTFGAERCLRDGVVPWRRIGSTVIVATTRPEKFENHRAGLEESLGTVTMALTTEAAMHTALIRIRKPGLAVQAEEQVPLDMSCRGWDARAWSSRCLTAFGLTATLSMIFPIAVFSALALWAVLTLAASLAVKIAALAIAVRQAARSSGPGGVNENAPPTIARLPTVSVMVPLFAEEEIADRLVRRLSRLDYPRELTDVLLVVEEEDQQTAAALARTRLPHWMRVVTVPRGGVKTKPRALNYALNFCRGQIVGVWDAEDAPDPDQLHKVVARFHQRGPDVACLQGRLDYYNARTNWLSRCFTIEYASWFGVVLPGLQRMGFALPLGGTTLFFRRVVLEQIGGWDAHNVTEDADLGMRLARLGYRTEMIETVTREEANCRILPWIRQRSRWLKGYAMTWAVHSRAPGRLLRDLGAWKFLGFQLLFLGTLSQFLLAPVLWSFWLLALGLPHPLAGLLPGSLHVALVALFVTSEVVNIAAGAFAVRDAQRRFLIPWAITQHFYFPLAALASYKAFYEILTRPFYWDKTRHGIHDEPAAPEAVSAGV
ncbi:glycosyltransferase [Tropicimonas sp.]|uniref:glycosyltransferase n=1 Tax=Tropicimonas sp. TaxID=2067044 RepID=UPI003A863E79